MFRLILLWLLLCGSAVAQPRLPLQGAGGTVGGSSFCSPCYPIDVVASPTAFYSLRAGSNAIAATGTQKSVNVRRSSDSTTSDIVILTTGVLDVATATTFANVDATGTGAITGTTLTFTGGHVGDVVTGGGTSFNTVIVSGASPTWTVNNSQTVASSTLTLTSGLYVTKWYDQSGNTNDLAQATAASQPQLILANPPYVLFAGAQLLTKNPLSATVAQPNSFSAVASRTANFTGIQVITSSFSASGQALNFLNSTNTGYFYAGAAVNYTISNTTVHAIQLLVNGASSDINVDGTDTTGNPGASANGAFLTIGDFFGGGFPLTGQVFEVGMWPVGFTGTDRNNLCHNDRAYYGTPGTC